VRPILVVLAALACFVAACSSGQPPSFSVTGASVDPTYWCPGGSRDAPYDVHGAVNVRNGTGGAVTIQSVTAEMRLAAVQGSWLEKVGDRYDAGAATFTPDSVGPGSSTEVRVTIKSSCTSNRYEFGGSSHGDYSVTVHLVTSAGTFSVTAQNQHEIRAA
jgi:hypothetical protein